MSHQFFVCTHKLSLHIPTFVMHYSKCNTLSVRTLNCRLLQRQFSDVAQTPARITDIKLSRMSCAVRHLLSWNRHTLATKKVKKAEKVKKFGFIHTLGSVPDQGEMFEKFGLYWFRNVNLYKVQTNKQPFSYICKIIWYERVNLYNQQKMIELRKKHTQTD